MFSLYQEFLMRKANNIRCVSEALLCSNCGACKAICPKDAISFVSTPLGRMYAVVNNNCIDCGLCTQVCPTLDKQDLHDEFEDRFIGTIQNVYVGRSTDEDIFRNAQSGGVCTAILSYLFDTMSIDCAILCKMGFGHPAMPMAVVVHNKEQLRESQKSCYTPVELLSSLKQTKDKDSVAIVGLPCHIQGVESLIRKSKKFKNIRYKLGLVCDRTLCSGILDVVTALSSDIKEDVKLAWRDKTARIVAGEHYYYRNAPITLTNKLGRVNKLIPNQYRFALKDFFTAPRCRVCYDKLNTFADVVLGDPWGMTDVDWVSGDSLVVVRTETGNNLIKDMMGNGYLSLSTRNVSELYKGQNIEARRISVAKYSSALHCMPAKVNSYLYRQGDDDTNCIKEKKELTAFIHRDAITKEEMLSQAFNTPKIRKQSQWQSQLQ